MGSITYETVPGFFREDNVNPESGAIEAILPHFGLLSESWDIFFSSLKILNENAERDGAKKTMHKLILFTRHGEADFEGNVGMRTSKLEDDSEKEKPSPDPGLTTKGQEEAHILHKAWKSEIDSGLPIPGRFYCCPLTRLLQTFQIVFDGILPNDKHLLVFENFHQLNGLYTTSKRKPRSEIETAFPKLRIVFESGFAEEDPLWRLDSGFSETEEDRVRQVLSVIFAGDEQFISITPRNQLLNEFFSQLGLKHRDLNVPVGGAFAVVVKAVRDL